MLIHNISIKSIKPYEKNPRKNKKAVDKVAASIKEFGFKQPIVADMDGIIIAGHTRYAAAIQLGLSEVPVLYADDLTPDQVKAYRLADNKTAEFATWDIDLLAVELELLCNANFDMKPFGFNPVEPEIVEDDFDITLPEEPKSKLGEIYQLGKHRLMVGDSTEEADVDKLMAGEVADLCITDPPYNVNYTGKNEKAMKIMNDNMAKDTFYSFLLAAYCMISKALKPGGVIYVFHSDTEGINFRTGLIDAGFKLSECLIWVKNSMVLGHSDYQWRHEPILYGWKEGAGHYIIDDRTLTTVIEQNKETNRLHPTMKPISILSKLILNSSRQNEIVIDTFGGSGSTLIACEQTGRTCRMMELDPKYADVIITRFEEYTGNKAKRLWPDEKQLHI